MVKSKDRPIKPSRLEVKLKVDTEEILNTYQPRTISINGVEIPTASKLFRDTAPLVTEIDDLKKSRKLFFILFAVQSIAIIVLATMQLC